jgi:hypothetical protein
MEMAEELGLNDEEQVLLGTRGTRGALSALALGGTRVLSVGSTPYGYSATQRSRTV